MKYSHIFYILFIQLLLLFLAIFIIYDIKFEGVDKLMTSRHLCAIRLHERKTAMP